MESACPNIFSCKLVINKDFIISKTKKKSYLETYCNTNDEGWSKCTRYIVNKTIHFCPDFVLPDSNMTPGEVIDKFDKETDI